MSPRRPKARFTKPNAYITASDGDIQVRCQDCMRVWYVIAGTPAVAALFICPKCACPYVRIEERESPFPGDLVPNFRPTTAPEPGAGAGPL